ncbi:MAG: hypothetical protein AAGH92_13835, partial [Planctomycetota bacterium]
MTGLNLKVMPTFIGIGGQRCRSTWIHKILSEHPSVFVTPRKELQYFTYRAETEDLDWYAREFAGAEGYKVRGEITPAYSSLTLDRVR